MVIIYFLAVAFLAASVQSQTCGLRPFARTTKIVNGFEAAVGDWGWQVSLTTYGQHFCGGVLINNQWVLTAAHCFQQQMPSLSIDLGVHDRSRKESWSVSRKASRIIVHKNFNMQIMKDDITMIKLDRPVTLDNRYIIPACLPSPGLNVQGLTGWVTGWGSSRIGGQTTTRLMEVSMPILTDTRCKQRYGSMVNTASTVCAGEYNVNSGACQGDSGGPFVVRSSNGQYYVVGLTSWGQDCGVGTVFTRVSYYYNWIQNNINSY